MEQILLAVHVLLAIGLVVSVLMQRSEGGGLGVGGGSGGGGFMTGRGAASLMTKTTSVLAALFITTSLGLAVLNRADAGGPSLIESVDPSGLGAPAAPTQPLTAPAAPTRPLSAPVAPTAPLAAPEPPRPPLGQ